LIIASCMKSVAVIADGTVDGVVGSWGRDTAGFARQCASGCIGGPNRTCLTAVTGRVGTKRNGKGIERYPVVAVDELLVVIQVYYLTKATSVMIPLLMYIVMTSIAVLADQRAMGIDDAQEWSLPAS